MTSYANFGYIAKNSRGDMYRWLVGHPNLFKRLQANDIMNALDLRDSDRVLDFGCGGSGMFTIEMAKIAAESIGVDAVTPAVARYVPAEQTGRLKFLTADGRNLPFENNYFDVILASEIIYLFPSEFLSSISRVLKPGGRLVLVNGIGHPAIIDVYASNSILLRSARFLWPKRFPVSYDAYVEALGNFYGAAFSLKSREYYRDLLLENNYSIISETQSPSFGASWACSWDQFLYYVRTGKANPVGFFPIKYYLFSLIGKLSSKGESNGQILVATKGT